MTRHASAVDITVHQSDSQMCVNFCAIERFMPMPVLRTASLTALMLLAGCAYGYDNTYAPAYPPGYDSGMGSGWFGQPGDQFGGQDVASIEVFQSALAPYGRWVDSRFGRGFQPRTAPGWRPYVNGRWGENRLWISDDPWGWATDHYGRWGHDDRIGWVWVPGTQWAPSWVAWRDADQLSGWAPIPPGVTYSFGLGFGNGWGFDNWNSWYGPSWVWVPRANLYRPGFGGAVLPWNNGFNYWNRSRWNHYSGWNGRPGYGRPVYGRPGNGRPPNLANRPVDANGNWNGNRPGYDRNDGRRRSDNGQMGYDRTDRQNWQGRPRDGSADAGNWQGRPGNFERQNRDAGNRPDRPDRTPRATNAGPQAVAAAGQQGYDRPPRAERPPSYAPPRRDQRPAEPRNSGRERFEQPE
jgi:hypothetical protein